jgi:hypothetical protein
MPRSPGYRHHQDTRKKIQAAQIINRLEKHVFADEPLLDASQVNAAKALLNKVLPDLSAVSVDGEMKHDVSDPLKALMERIAANGKRIHGND